jgi:hypothetical protein
VWAVGVFSFEWSAPKARSTFLLSNDDRRQRIELRPRTLKNVKITFESAVAEGASVVGIHRAEAEKIAGGKIAIRAFALFAIDQGKIVLCDELTRLEKGAAEDRDLASRPIP